MTKNDLEILVAEANEEYQKEIKDMSLDFVYVQFSKIIHDSVLNRISFIVSMLLLCLMVAFNVHLYVIIASALILMIRSSVFAYRDNFAIQCVGAVIEKRAGITDFDDTTENEDK